MSLNPFFHKAHSFEEKENICNAAATRLNPFFHKAHSFQNEGGEGFNPYRDVSILFSIRLIHSGFEIVDEELASKYVSILFSIRLIHSALCILAELL